MKKNLSTAFPDIFGDVNESVLNWQIKEKKMKTARDEFDTAILGAKKYFKDKILERTKDEVLKNIFQQPTVSRAGAESISDVLEDILRIHMSDNGSKGYKEAKVPSQMHLVKIFPGVQDMFEKRFYIDELNAEIWFRQRAHDEENVILCVEEIEEVLKS